MPKLNGRIPKYSLHAPAGPGVRSRVSNGTSKLIDFIFHNTALAGHWN